MNKYTSIRQTGKLDTTVSGKLLYMALMDIADDKSEITIPQKRVGKLLGIHKSTVSKNLRRLEQIGVLQIFSTFNECGGRMPNRYVIREIR